MNQVGKQNRQNYGKIDQFIFHHFDGVSMIRGEYAGYKLNTLLQRFFLEYAIDSPNIFIKFWNFPMFKPKYEWQRIYQFLPIVPSVKETRKQTWSYAPRNRHTKWN